MIKGTTGGPTLDIVQDGRMTTGATSSTERTDTLDMGVVVKDAGKDIGHDDEE